jgi:HK97 family phage major capsid protein/HK97 family phage prohead protease
MDLRYTPAVLELKAADDADRILEGIATTPTPDRGGDIIEPLGAQFTLPIPLLWQHDQRQPIGEVIAADVTPSGIRIKARIARVAEPGALKDRLDEAYHTLKANLVRGLSIGWLPIDLQPIRGSFGMRAVKWAWHELSAVTIPQNPDSLVTAVKSATIARKDRAMLQTDTTAERIAQLENARAAKVARLSTLMETATKAGITIDGGEDAEEYDGLELDVKKIDGDLVRLRTLETMNRQAATPVTTTTPRSLPAMTPTSTSPMGTVRVKSNLAPATEYIRHVQAVAQAKGNLVQAAEIARNRWPDTPQVELLIKAAVVAGTTTDATWAGPLAPFKPMQDEFIEYLRPATLLGRIPNLRSVPFLVSVPSQTGGAIAQWVGENAPKPVGALQFGTITLGLTKCAIIVVITDELARNSTPSAEGVIRTDLVNAIAYLVDTEFTLPARAPVPNVAPGSITNGVTPITSAGTSPSNGRTDIAALIAGLVNAGLSAGQAVLLMSETNAAALSVALNPLGQPLFPALTVTGGSALGVQVITSQSVGSNVILLHAPSILLADDGGVSIDVSREASLQMDSAPMSPPDATVVFKSLWQSNCVGLRAERAINWKKARAGCVQYTVQTYVP